MSKLNPIVGGLNIGAALSSFSKVDYLGIVISLLIAALCIGISWKR
jgi:hypothetical protein